MAKQKKPENYFFNLVLFLAAFIITAICTLTGSYSHEGYSLKVGDVSDRRFKATRRIENTVATERNRNEAKKAALDMKPIPKKDTEINERVIKNVTDLFIKLDTIRSVYQTELEEQAEAEREAAKVPNEPAPEPEPSITPAPELDNPLTIVSLSACRLAVSGYEAKWRPPAIPYNAIRLSMIPEDSADGPLMPLSAMEQLDTLQLTLSDSQSRLLLNMDDDRYDKLKQTILQSLENVLEQGVYEVDAKSLLSIQDEMSKFDITSDMRNIGYQIASSFLEPNYIADIPATEAARQEIASRYTIAYKEEGETIVDEGQIISVEAFALLEALGLISDGLQDSLIQIIASIVLEGVMFILFFLYIKMFTQKLITHKKEAAMLFTIYAAVITIIRLLINLPIYQFLPILSLTMLVAMLIEIRLSIVLNMFITITAMLIYKGSIEFFIFFTIAGMAVSLLSKYTTERNQVFIVGIVASALSFVLMFLISIFFQRTYSHNILIEAGYAAGNGIFTVVVCLGSLPFWEAFFGVTTNIKLLDLTNQNSALLRKLIIEAPGTYHHSLVVANLAETAAYDIGADANLTRAGGYYHDVGKIKNPHFFVENQNHLGESPHNNLTSLESVKIIIEHVQYGIELAREYKLPQAVIDFIIQHHGNTLMQYFYCEAKEERLNGEEVNEADFRYPFDIPQNRETAVLMLADTVEAALRSMKKGFKDLGEIERDIKRLIKAKLDDGQLLDSGLSIKDLDLITRAFLRVFKGMYHERIEYPEMETTEKMPSEGEISTA